MAKIGELVVDFIARTSNFEKRTKRVSKNIVDVKKSAASAVGILGKFGGALTGIGVGLSVAGIASHLKKTADEIDRLAKTSDKLGVTTEALAGLQHAASSNGIEAQKLAIGLQRMTRRVSEAASGVGVLVEPLQQLNIDAAELVKLSPDKQFERVAAALSKIPNQSDRIATAFKFFDSEGVDLVRLAGQNLQKYNDEAKRLGIAISREDAAKVEAFNDSLERVGRAFQGVANKVVISAAPGLVETLDGFMILYEDYLKSQGKKVNFQGRVKGQETRRASFATQPITAAGEFFFKPRAGVGRKEIASPREGNRVIADLLQREAVERERNERNRHRETIAALKDRSPTVSIPP